MPSDFPWMRTDLATVLNTVVDQLVAQGCYAKENCFLALSRPSEPPMVSGEEASGEWCIVYPLEGPFDQGLAAGGGDQQCLETATVIVEMFIPDELDEQGRDKHFLTNPENGASVAIKQVLKALKPAVFNPTVNGVNLLVEPMRPIGRYSPSRDDEDASIGTVALGFECKFMWDLS